MTFEEAGQYYTAYRAQADAGQMNPGDFQAAVEQLKVQDPSGVWWQMGPAGEWLSWNGTAWVSQAQPSKPPQAQWKTPGKANQMFWDVLSVAGSSVMAYAWYWYSSLDKSLNQPDWKSAITMVVLPILMIALRGPLDRLLAPIQKFRQSIPPMALVGLGIAIPFLVTNYLYAQGISNYPLMFRTYVISTLLSYVVLRTPSQNAMRGRV
jgi:drug/metabolite transporter (DMT)-like permease